MFTSQKGCTTQDVCNLYDNIKDLTVNELKSFSKD